MKIQKLIKSQTSIERRLGFESVWGVYRIVEDEHPVDNSATMSVRGGLIIMGFY